MTHCIGWIYKGNIYMAADSAVTKEEPASLTSSSFGEVYQEIEGKTVEEGLLKIVCLQNRTVIAFAGNVAQANSIIDYLKDMLPINQDIEDIIKSMGKSLGPFDKNRSVSIIVGKVVNKIPVMYLWNSINLELKEIRDGVVQIGSADLFHRELNRFLLSLLAQGNVPTDRILPIAMSVMQSYIVHEYMLTKFIGGIHYGLVLNSDEIMWHEDIKYILYDSDFKNVNIITCLCRDGAVIVRSSITNDSRVFLHGTNTQRPIEWMQRWKQHLDDCFSSGKAKYWVFIGILQRNVTVVKMPEPTANSKYFYLKYLGDGVYDFAIEEIFKSFLKKPLNDRNNGSLPFRLTSMNG